MVNLLESESWRRAELSVRFIAGSSRGNGASRFAKARALQGGAQLQITVAADACLCTSVLLGRGLVGDGAENGRQNRIASNIARPNPSPAPFLFAALRSCPSHQSHEDALDCRSIEEEHLNRHRLLLLVVLSSLILVATAAVAQVPLVQSR